MNTPAHLLINFGLLARKQPTSLLIAVGFGAILPDLPMIIFYLYEKMINVPESVIWSEHYYLPQWQNFFDVFNSIPIVLLLCFIAHKIKNRHLLFIGLSMMLHFALDLPLHHDDGHRHFFPLSDWRFVSPVSYWDAAYYGRWVMVFEAAVSLLAAGYLLKQRVTSIQRWIVGLCALSYILFFAFATVHWGG